jgi:hypothetical protein
VGLFCGGSAGFGAHVGGRKSAGDFLYEASNAARAACLFTLLHFQSLSLPLSPPPVFVSLFNTVDQQPDLPDSDETVGLFCGGSAGFGAHVGGRKSALVYPEKLRPIRSRLALFSPKC